MPAKAGSPPPALDIQGCDQLDVDALLAIFSLEASSLSSPRATAPARIEVLCEDPMGARIVVLIASEDETWTRRHDLREESLDTRPRLVALMVAEALADWSLLRETATLEEIRAQERAQARAEQASMGEELAGGVASSGAEIAVATRAARDARMREVARGEERTRVLSLQASLGFAELPAASLGGSVAFQHRLTRRGGYWLSFSMMQMPRQSIEGERSGLASFYSAALGPELVLRRSALELRGGPGFRVGVARFHGRTDEVAVAARDLALPFAGPLGQVSAAYWIGRVRLALTGELGYAAVGAAATVSADERWAMSGLWGTLEFGVGVAF